MGRYSGKCDFSDSIDIHGVDNILKSTIKIRKEDGLLIKLDLQNEKDLIPYYPYLVSMGYHNKIKDVVELCADSFIDEEERERIDLRLKEVIEYCEKYKNTLGEISKEQYIKSLGSLVKSDELYSQIIDEVNKYGDKAECKYVHDHGHEHYRREWFEHMVEEGYDKNFAFCWVYKEFSSDEEKIRERINRFDDLNVV